MSDTNLLELLKDFGASGPFAERHYSVLDIAETWGFSEDKVREMFENEPGVLIISDTKPRRKRRYRTLRIPESVAHRVHLRLSIVSNSKKE